MALAAAFLACATFAHAGVLVVPRYRSPKNHDRRVRKTTELIVLHTTEAPARGSLKHLSERGECHYCVTEDGTIYSIVDRSRVAFHAGQSMWNGKEDVDDFSIGIECVGYHDQAMPKAQLNAVSTLVKDLQKTYGIPDERVVTHSMVAYGEANKWHKKKNRGRKRCGMLFAMPSVRAQLGLSAKAAFDPDVRAKRLIVGDEFLSKVLYGKIDTMKKTYGAAKTALVDPTKQPVRKPAAAPRQAVATAARRPAPAAPAQAPSARGATASARPARPAKPAPSAPSKSFKTVPQSIAELKKQGFAPIGTITKANLPGRIAGDAWNAPDTYYTIRGRVVPGNILNPAHVEEGMNVWRKGR